MKLPSITTQGLPANVRLGNFALVAFDMDSTLINIECVDEIADRAGKRLEVARITEAAMQGLIADYKESLRQRVALLRGVHIRELEYVYEHRLQFNPGVERFVSACREAGLKTLLVSGGFTFFAERVRSRLQLDFARSNELEVIDGHLSGRLVPQSWGDIVDGDEKRKTLLEVCHVLGIGAQQCIAVGDGANDLPMMGAAGLSIAFHAKPVVAQKAHISILSGGMDQVLPLLGYAAMS